MTFAVGNWHPNLQTFDNFLEYQRREKVNFVARNKVDRIVSEKSKDWCGFIGNLIDSIMAEGPELVTLASPDVKFEGPEEVRMADWLEGSLKRYATNMISRKSRHKIEYSKEEVIRFPIHITSLRYSSRGNEDPSDCEKDINSHTISEIAITYCFSQDGIDRPQYFLSKSSRAFCNEEKGGDLDTKSSFRVQEINFYTKVVPGLEDWANNNDYSIQLPLPYCYFGSYECTKIERVDQRTKDYLTSIGIKYKGYDEDMKHIHPNGFNSTYDPTDGFTYEMNAVIVLDEVTKTGYGKCLQFQLNIEEVMVAAKKIAEVHALSYAWETLHKKSIKLKWAVFPRSKEFAKICSDSILQAFPVFIKLLKSYSQNQSTLEAITRLEILEKKIPKKISKLLRPANYPEPNGIMHMDLCPANIFFLKESSTSEDKSECFATTMESQLPGVSEIKRNFRAQPVVDDLPEVNMNQLKISAESENENVIEDCRFIGWNMFNFGPVLHDVAFLIFTSLSPELRRSYTVNILKNYYGAFRAICDELDVDLPFSCQMLYDQFPNSLLFASLMAIRSFNDNATQIDAAYLNHFAEVFTELVQLNCI